MKQNNAGDITAGRNYNGLIKGNARFFADYGRQVHQAMPWSKVNREKRAEKRAANEAQ
jgi:hypothetical protein